MLTYIAPLTVLVLLLGAAALGGPLFLLGALLLGLAALLVLLRQFNLLGYRPAVGAATVITLYLILSGQQLAGDTLAGATLLQGGVVLAALVVVTLVLRLSEHDTRRAVLNWTLTISGALYIGLLLSYLPALYNLHPDLAYAGEAGRPTLMTTAYAQLGGASLPSLPAVGWPINPPPTPAPSPSAQWLMIGLLATTLFYLAALRPLARRWAIAPLVGSLLLFALGWLVGWAIAVLLGLTLLALNLASLTQPLIVADNKLTGGWLLALAHHLALLAPIVYYAVVWWS